jgi:hypothetical protein
MQTYSIGTPLRLLLGLTGILSLAAISIGAQAAQVVELTQVPCQFIESEQGVDHGYRSQSKADCEAINDQSAEVRLSQAETINLKPGDTIFRVTNKSVSYALGFWLRGEGLIGYASLPSVSGGGLTTGTTRDYKITLKPGAYIYSCPLNPTPNYRLVVSE